MAAGTRIRHGPCVLRSAELGCRSQHAHGPGLPAARTSPLPRPVITPLLHVAVTTALLSPRCTTALLPCRCYKARLSRRVPRRVPRRATRGIARCIARRSPLLAQGHKGTRLQDYKAASTRRARRSKQHRRAARPPRPPRPPRGRGESGRPRPPYCRGQGSQPVATPSCEQPKDDRPQTWYEGCGNGAGRPRRV